MVAALWGAAMRSLVIFFSTGAYTGEYVPIAPGTRRLSGIDPGILPVCAHMQHSPATFLMLFLINVVAAVSRPAARKRSSTNTTVGKIVIDEILGMIATMFLNPTGWIALIAGFVLFRIFDIIKPLPASRIDRLRGGAGVMFDDMAAGIYANLVLQVIRRLI